MRLIFLLSFMSCLAGVSPLDAQTCRLTLYGRVTLPSGQPVEGAAVTVSSDGKIIHAGSVTQADGTYRISGLCEGRWMVTVRHVGISVARQTVDLRQDLQLHFFIESDNTQLEDVVVHDHRQNGEEGLSTSALSREELSATAGKSLGETLRQIAGVNTIQAGPGIFKPVIHGVHSQRILMLNHGVRQEGQQWGAEHAPEIDPLAAGDIRVIKDASAIRYGVDAIGGVVIVNPPALPEEAGLGGHIQVIGQTNGWGGTLSGSLQGGINGAKGWGWRVQGTARNSGDFQAPRYNLSNTGLKERHFTAALGHHGKKGGAEWLVSRFQSDIGILRGTAVGSMEDLATAMSADEPQGTTGFSYRITEPRQAVEHWLVRMKFHRLMGQGEWRGQYAWQRNSRQEYDLRRGGLSELPAIDLVLDTHTLDQEWQPSLGENRQLIAGLNAMLQNNRNVPGTQRIPFIPNFTSATGGLYVSGKSIRESLTVDAGIRYDWRMYDVSGRDFRNVLYQETLVYHNVSATAGLTRRMSSQSTINTSLSSAWRPPHVAELFSLGTHQSAAAIEYGLFLDPETNQVRDREDVEFRNEQSLKWVTGWAMETERLDLSITGYASGIFNYFWLRPGGITRNIRGAYPYFRYTQTDAFFAGIDIEAGLPIRGRARLGWKGSWLHATDAKNRDRLIGIPPGRTEVNLRREFGRGEYARSFHIELTAAHVFRQFRAPMVVHPEAFLGDSDPLAGTNRNFDFQHAPAGYTLIGVNAGFRMTRGKTRYEVRLAADNLLDAAYREYTNRFRYFSDDIGRNIKLNLKLIF